MQSTMAGPIVLVESTWDGDNGTETKLNSHVFVCCTIPLSRQIINNTGMIRVADKIQPPRKIYNSHVF